MIKFLECADLHYDPKWDEIFQKLIVKIIATAAAEKVDFIIVPGDLLNRPLLATDKGGYNKIREFIKAMSTCCPVVAIHGTPSHDGPGCYEALKDCGLTLLEPNKVYGYSKTFSNILLMDKNHVVDCILFGIPELNKNNIMSKLNLSAEQANAEATKQFNYYVSDFIAPNRLKYKDIPAICLFHGVVSDSKKVNTDDVIIRQSDIVIHSEDLVVANINRWSLGHIHTPWESNKISAGYAGSWGKVWKETGFLPAFNLVEIDDLPFDNVDIKRIPYGTPYRKKIYSTYGIIPDPNIAYWLETSDHNYCFPSGSDGGSVHPWSRITYINEKKETQRTTKEQRDNIKSLVDLFKILDPDVTKIVIDKVNMIDMSKDNLKDKQLDIKLKSIKIKGCIFFGEKELSFDLNNLTSNMIEIAGDNGSGKSSLVSFCSPYPVIIGKDPLSGRPSAIKDFFSGQDSSIGKLFDVNGVEHKHLITIKGAHTRTPKIECYLYMNNRQVLDKTSFDTMMEECEKLYGPYQDYFLTNFYVQPMQGKTQSSLMTANMTDIRNLVQSISGIDRENEKREALNNIKNYDEQIKEKESWISGAKTFAIDIDQVEKIIMDLQNKELDSNSELEKQKALKVSIDKKIESLLKKKSINDIEINNKKRDQERLVDVGRSMIDRQEHIFNLKAFVKNLDENKGILKEIVENEKLIIENEKMKNEYDNEIFQYNKDLHELQTEIEKKNNDNDNEYRLINQKYQDIKITINIKINQSNSEIEILDKKCPNCNWIDPESSKKIWGLKADINDLQIELKNLVIPIKLELEPIPNNLDRPIPEQPKYHQINIIAQSKKVIENKIERGFKASAAIEESTKQINELLKEKKDLETKPYIIDNEIDEKLNNAKVQESVVSIIINNLTSETIMIAAQIKEKEELIKKEKETKEKIDSEIDLVKQHKANKDDWQYIANMLQANKIPALELDIVKDSIDAEATKIIKPFLEERYTIETETQSAGKSGIIDKFDIKIHDLEKGTTRSFLQYNPGHKAFFNDAYVKALIKIRNEKSNRKYSPAILDEADGPVQPERISQYYEMQKNYWNDTKVLIVSQKGQEYIEKKIYVKDLINE